MTTKNFNTKRNLCFGLLTIATALFVGYGHNARMANAASTTVTGRAQPLNSVSITYDEPKVVSNVFTSKTAALLFAPDVKVKVSRLNIGKTLSVVVSGEVNDKIEIRSGSNLEKLNNICTISKIGELFTFPSDGKTVLTVCCIHARQV